MNRTSSILLLLIVPFLCIVAGCMSDAQRRARQTATAQMDHAQELMEQDADSALAILQAVDSAALTDRPAKARYSLLMAQAVDKTSGLKDMAVVQDAIDYYADHGTPTDQMLTDYYQGVAYRSQLELAKAMECFLKAEKRGKESDFLEGKGRVLGGQGTIYYRLKEWDSYLDNCLKVADIYKQTDDTVSFYQSLYFVAIAYARLKDYPNERKSLERIKPEKNDPASKRQAQYYYELLLYFQNTNQRDSILALASVYSDLVNLSAYDSLDLVHCYIQINEPALARQYMPSSDKDLSEYLMKRRWLSLNIMLCNAEGNYKECVKYYSEYEDLQDSVRQIESHSTANVTQEYQSVKTTLDQQRSKNRQTSVFIWLAIPVILLLAAGLVIYLRKHRLNKQLITTGEKEREESNRIADERINKIKEKLAEAENSIRLYDQREKEILVNLENLKTAVDLKDSEINHWIAETEKLNTTYINAFNQSRMCKNLIVALGIGDENAKNNLLQQFKKMFNTKDDFINFALESLKADLPKVYEWFIKCKLTRNEIALCSLLRYGLTMKEIHNLLPNFKNNNSTSIIRKKLGLTEQDPFLRVILFNESMEKYIR